MSVSLNSSNALTVLQSVTSSSTASLVSILYGNTTQTSGDPVANLVRASKSETKEVAQQAKMPETKRDIDRFLAVAKSAKDLKTLLADPTARKVFLTANGLGDQTDYPALAQKALSSDTSKDGNLASKLSDTRWLSIAKTYSFASKGLSVVKSQTSLDAITKGYAEVKWRESLDKTTPGLSAALDFRSRASTITSAVGILGDKNIREVVTVALGIPKQIAYQPLEAQEKAITDRLDVRKLKDSKFVEQMARNYLIQNNLSSTNNSSSTTLSLFG